MKTESLLTQTKRTLRRFNLKARKRLGQHFLIDGEVLQLITSAAELTPADIILEIGPDIFPLKNVEIIKSSIPVNRPTTRGGVYFSDTFAFKIKAQVTDLSLVPLLSKSMLGPNTDFQDLQIITNIKIDNSFKKITFLVHLTNSMQSSSYIELHMTIIKIKYE